MEQIDQSGIPPSQAQPHNHYGLKQLRVIHSDSHTRTQHELEVFVAIVVRSEDVLQLLMFVLVQSCYCCSFKSVHQGSKLLLEADISFPMAFGSTSACVLYRQTE